MSDLHLHNLQELTRPRGCTDNLVYNTAFGLIIDFEHMGDSGISNPLDGSSHARCERNSSAHTFVSLSLHLEYTLFQYR